MWIYRMHFAGDRECFAYDPMGYQGSVGTEKELPYLESLLNFLEMDCGALDQ